MKALELLNDVEHEKFFDNNNFRLFSDDIYIVYKIIFQLIKNNEIKNISNKKEFYEKMGNYVHKHIKDNKVGDFFKKMVNEFEFSEENLFQIKKIIKGKEEKLKPRNYSQICATTGLVIFLVKDILEYLGLSFNNSNKGKPIFVLMNLEFLEKVKIKLPNYSKIFTN